MNAKAIKEKALQLGFTACGIIPAEPFEEYRQSLDERIASFPESKALYEPLYDIVNPPEGAKSIIVCTMGATQYKVPESLSKYIGKHYLFDGRLSYSKEFRANEEFETFLKISNMRVLEGGVPDRWAAAKAGVGKFGRNNFTYTEAHGSYVCVHTWIVDTILDYDPAPESTMASQCTEGCMLCVHACPTSAMSDGLSMNRGRCLPQISNDTENLPDASTREQMVQWMYGCDACQDVCPMNAGKFKETEDFPLLAQFEPYMQPENILEMDEDTYKNIVNPRFWYIGEDGLWLWKYNALRIMINNGDAKYHHLIKKYSSHEDTRIREVAEWGCKKLGLH
ncbi:MAG: epoxyqueuosine reductase [Defluviitaleaceae bacterium]|nr:epoxyqueuosine reductase [Defluviitaleaceae bacterium]